MRQTIRPDDRFRQCMTVDLSDKQHARGTASGPGGNVLLRLRRIVRRTDQIYGRYWQCPVSESRTDAYGGRGLFHAPDTPGWEVRTSGWAESVTCRPGAGSGRLSFISFTPGGRSFMYQGCRWMSSTVYLSFPRHTPLFFLTW